MHPDDTMITEVITPEPAVRNTKKHTRNNHQMSSRFPPLTREKGTDIFSFHRPRRTRTAGNPFNNHKLHTTNHTPVHHRRTDTKQPDAAGIRTDHPQLSQSCY